VTADASDATAHSQWAPNARVVMAAGTVEASWLLTIHDDDAPEGDEACRNVNFSFKLRELCEAPLNW
jgi:hypothetical protein